MASVWDQYAKPKQTSIWDQYKTQPTAEPDYYDIPETPPPTPSRGVFGAANDYVIEAANAILGGGKALIDFAVPGTELANQIEGLIQQGAESQSQVAQQAKQQLSQDIDAGGMQALKGVGSYVLENPLLATSQAIGSFAIPGVAIKGAQAAARGLGVGERAVGRARQVGPITPEMAAVAGQQAVGRVGLGAGAFTGAALGGGDAAGQAYQTVFDATGNETLATIAAREAAIAPAAIGGLTGLIGAERIFAGLGKAGRGGRVRTAATTGLSEAAQETIEEGGTQLSANIAAGQYVPGIDPMSGVVGSAALGFALGGITGAGIGGLTGGPSDPKDLINAGNEFRQQQTLARLYREEQLRERPLEGLIRPGPGLSTQDLIKQITGVTRSDLTPEEILARRRDAQQSMEAALNEPTGQMVAGPGGIERPQTAGEMYGVPPAPARAAQPAAQQTQGAQRQAQATQIDPAVVQQVAQIYGVQQVPPGPGVPTQAFIIAGKTVIGVPRVNQIVNEIAQANQNKDPERVQLEAAIITSGIPLSGQASAKGILGGIDSVIKKYQLDGAATLNDAANILEFQISQGKSPKSVEPMARIYEALTNQMSPAFQRLTEGPTPAAGTAPLTPPESLGLMQQPIGVSSGQPTSRAAVPTATAPAGQPATAPAGQPATAPAGQPAAVQAQPIRAAQPVSAAPSPRTEEVTAGAQAWGDMNVSAVQYSDLTEQDRAAWDQAVAEGRATGEAQEQLAKEYELIQEQGFMQQVLDRIIGRVIKSPNKARYFSTFLAAGAKQQDIIAKATENAERDADGNITERAQKQLKALSQELSALRGAPNPELAAEYGVALDTLKEWNQQLRTFLTNKSVELQEAARVVAVELRLEGGDLRNILSQMVVRNQQAQVELQTATQLGQAVFDETILADQESGMALLQDRTAASVQEVFNASETINARYLRLQQELQNAENDGNEQLTQEITEKLDVLAEEAVKQATKQTGKRPVRGEKDAVPKQEAEKVSVQSRAKAGEKVGQEVRRIKKPAGEGQAQKEEVKTTTVATTQEAAEAKYNELRQLVDDALPTWNKLSDAQQAALVEIDPAQMNMRDLQRIVDDSRTIDVEARVIPEAQRTLLLEQTSKLNESQTKLLESHYGDKAGTDAFLSKLSQDITTFVNRGAEFVAARIRGVIQQLAKAAISIAIVFNPNVTGNGFNFNLQEAYASIQANQVETTVPAEVAGQMSEEAKIIYRQVAPLAKEKQRGFIIADKRNGMLHTFFSNGQHLVSDTALFGADIGDTLQGDSLQGGKKITPAGKFTLQAVADENQPGGYRLDLVETNDGVGVIAIHPAYLGNVKEKRLERLASPDAKDNRISYGCINTSHETFLKKLLPQINQFNGGFIYVLPEAPFASTAKSQLPTPPAPKTPPQNAMRRRAEKHVQELTDTDQNLMLEDASIDELTEAYEGVSWLRNRYESLGLGNVFSAVGQFFVSYNTNVNWDGIITNIDNQVSVVLRRDIAAQKGASLWTMGHELGHAVDRVIQGDNTYSSDQRLNLRKTKDRVVPMGEVAVEMANLRKKNDAVDTVLSYPYDFNEVSDLTTEGVRQELFAQLWALYTTNDVTRDIIDQQAPKTSAFMKEVLANVQTTENFNATNLTGPAFDSRKEGFPQRRDRPDESVGTAAQVAAAQQNLSVARSRNAQAAVNAIDGIPPTVKAASNVILQSLRNWTRKGVDRVVFTEALINRAVEAGIKSAAEFKQLMQARGVETRKFEKEVERIADMYALVPDKDRGTGTQSVNAFLYDSTRTKKWGFTPKWRTAGVAVDGDLKTRFDALSSEAQSFVRAVFKHGDDTLALKKKILMDYTNSEYDAQIKAAQADGNTKLVSELQKEKVADLKKFDTLFKLREGIPYAPLKRIGKYAVVAKSSEFRAAETAKNKKLIRELEQDSNHYQVTFVDSDIQARNLQKQLQDQGFYGTNDDAVYYFEREKFQDELYGGNTMLAALSKLRATVERTGQDEKTTNQLRRIITDMYLHALADSSARKSELRRRAVPGEIDMLQSFAFQGRADANFLAAVQYNNRTQEALQKMRKQAKEGGNRTRKSELLNELNGRYIQSLEYEPNQTVQKLNRLTSVYFLASSPGYYLQNFTQPWMMSLPVMAGRHDYIKSANAIYNAYFDLKDVMKSAKLFEQQFDFSKVPDDVRDVIETLVNRSQIDIGISTEMGEFNIEGQGPVTDTWNKIDKGLRLAVQKVEAINRLTTAIAAYRLELAKTGNKDLAVDYASSIINDTHGDYSGFNAPRMFNTNVGKVALQFRKFQLIQLGLLAKLVKNSFEKGPEQQVARKALGYILAQTAVLTGVMGMPGAAAIAWALEGLFGDEEEPLDIKGKIRDAIGNDDIANIVLYGLPNLAGVNLSGKIGMGNALSIMPFTEINNLNGDKTYQIIGTLLGGPAGGMAARMADGMSYISAGDEYKGLELMLPKGLGDAMRSVRVYSEGFTSRRGDVLLPSDQIGEVTAFWQFLGLTPTQTSVRGEKQGRVIDLERNFSSRSTSLKRQYSEAARDRNITKQSELRRQWLDLQAARVRDGYPRSPMSELTSAPQEQRKRERQTSEGVPFTQQSRRFVERITE